ncbi:hypothetical protein ACWD0Z_39470, partial [Streptomyces sp. NPDC003007]
MPPRTTDSTPQRRDVDGAPSTTPEPGNTGEREASAAGTGADSGTGGDGTPGAHPTEGRPTEAHPTEAHPTEGRSGPGPGTGQRVAALRRA